MVKLSELEVTVSVEAALNNALYDVATKLYAEHGLRVRSVEFTWIENHAVGCPTESFLTDVTVTSSGSGKP